MKAYVDWLVKSDRKVRWILTAASGLEAFEAGVRWGRMMIDPALPPDVVIFKYGNREVGRIVNIGEEKEEGEQ